MKLTYPFVIAFGIVHLSCSGVFGREAVTPLDAIAAQRRLAAHVRTWSTDQGVNPRNVVHHYADRVIYYGKPMSRREILSDKLRYIAVWPIRRYSIRPGTAAVRCDNEGIVCRVSGIMRWYRRSRSGVESVGTARLSLTLSRGSGGKVVRESAIRT